MGTTRGRRAAVLEGAAGGGLLLLLLLVLFPPIAEARTNCSYAGGPSGVLTVTVSGQSIAVIKRSGLEITASEFLAERPARCTGGTPTVLNVDTVQVVLTRDANVDLRLDGGPFIPGATPETEGASEIEFHFSGPDALADVIGTSRGDEFHWDAGGANAGLNLNPRSSRDGDVDVTISGANGFLIANGAGGNDTITVEPGAAIRGGVFSRGGRGNDVLSAGSSHGILHGGPGNDVITGGRFPDLLSGGTGNDRVAGGGDSDDITGGPGRDLLSGGSGRDRIKSRDSKRDRVRCGRGRDRADADRRDRLRACEVTRRR